MKREFVQLAHKFNQARHCLGGAFVSEKLDGQRCYWDGGITRGMAKLQVPWANHAKDSRYLKAPIATGIWSRYGNVIHAPSWWLDTLPKMPLDGELYCGNRQELRKIIGSLDKGPGWDQVWFHCFDIPPYETMFAPGEIKDNNFEKIITTDMRRWTLGHLGVLDYQPPEDQPFVTTYYMLQKHLASAHMSGINGPRAAKRAIWHKQLQLPQQTSMAHEELGELLYAITSRGGEGLMIRYPGARYKCERTHSVLKVKPLDDMEGTVTGYTTGRETDKGSRLLGRMGALVLDVDGKRLELSGFTDPERLLDCVDKGFGSVVRGFDHGVARDWAIEHPGAECPPHIEASQFPRGTTVTFRYRGLTNDGIPNEARYWRKCDDE